MPIPPRSGVRVRRAQFTATTFLHTVGAPHSLLKRRKARSPLRYVSVFCQSPAQGWSIPDGPEIGVLSWFMEGRPRPGSECNRGNKVPSSIHLAEAHLIKYSTGEITPMTVDRQTLPRKPRDLQGVRRIIVASVRQKVEPLQIGPFYGTCEILQGSYVKSPVLRHGGLVMHESRAAVRVKPNIEAHW